MSISRLLCPLFLLILVLSDVCEGRIRYKYRKRAECRDKGPRRSDELPAVVLTGLIENVYPPHDVSQLYSASVHVKWIFKGPKKLQDSRVTIDGFGDPNLCSSSVNRMDSWIMTLDEVSEGLLRLNGTLLNVNLHNLDRITALTSDQPYRRRGEITELPCETQYCENNGNCLEEKADGIISRSRCQCLDSCSHTYLPICGSNGETFVNECKLRMESCLRQDNYFTRHIGTCEGGTRNKRDHAYQLLTPNGIKSSLNHLFSNSI